MRVNGKFDVQLTPVPPHHSGTAGMTLDRMTLAKTYHGALQATGTGEMLSARTPVPGSAGYVAMEQICGELAGKSGTFVVQHSGTMHGTEQSLQVSIVPDSGTGELAGISGALAIRIEGGVHCYELTYHLPECAGHG